MIIMAPTATVQGWMAPRKPFHGPPGHQFRRNRDQDLNALLWNQTSAVVENEDDTNTAIARVDDDVDEYDDTRSVTIEHEEQQEEDQAFDELVDSLQERKPRESHSSAKRDNTINQRYNQHDESSENEDSEEEESTVEDRFHVKGIVLIGEVDK
jgi:hypothetical protein